MTAKPLFERIHYQASDFPIIIHETRGVLSPPFQRMRYHPEVEIQLIRHGAGFYFIMDRQYPFRHNTLLVIPPHVVHYCLPSPGRMIHKIMMMIHPRILRQTRAWNRITQNSGICLNLSEDISIELLHLIQSMLREKTRKMPDWKAMIRLQLREFILLMCRAQNQAGTNVTAANNPVISRLVSFLDQNYFRPITISFLSKKTGYTRGYLTRIFKRQTGFGLKQYILHRRISAAQKMLKERPNLKTISISADVGFGDYSSFCYHFKAMTGFTPADYRTFAQVQDTKPYCL